MRYSLRTLAIAIAILAAVLGIWVQYRRVTMCQIRWLKPGSPEAAALVPATVDEEQLLGRRRIVYYPSHRRVQSLQRVIPTTGMRFTDRMSLKDESLEFVTRDAAGAETQLQALQQADVARPDLFVIRGRVADRAGKPLADANVDLLGPYVFINHCETRSDGTFILSLEEAGAGPPAGAGYYLRVRSADDVQSWQSSTFDLDPVAPERDVIVTVPR